MHNAIITNLFLLKHSPLYRPVSVIRREDREHKILSRLATEKLKEISQQEQRSSSDLPYRGPYYL